MAVKCPKCQFENPKETVYCGKCGSKIIPAEEISISHTKTLKTPIRRLELGSLFAERYEVLEEIGKGGMGEVYRVRDKTLDEEMALKLLKPEIAADYSYCKIKPADFKINIGGIEAGVGVGYEF